MFTFKNVLIVLLIITIIWIIYLFAKTLKTSATSGSFQKKLADRKKKLDNQKVKKLNLGEDFTRLADVEKINIESKATQIQEKIIANHPKKT